MFGTPRLTSKGPPLFAFSAVELALLLAETLNSSIMNPLPATDSPIGFDSDSPLYTALPYFPDSAVLVRQFQELLDSKWLTNRGLLVQRFEAEDARYLGNSKARVISCCNATVGLEIVLRAMGLRGKVIVTPMTFVSTLHSIVNAGLEPVFADIDPETFCLSPEAVERALSPEVCAVVPVHLYGHVCDIDYFEKLRGRGIRVVYDSAHAFGVKYRGENVGLFGDAEVFSFHATKILNACEGGAVVTRDDALADRIRLMTNFGILNETEVECVGTNGKLSEVHALFGLSSAFPHREGHRAPVGVVQALCRGAKFRPSLAFSARAEGRRAERSVLSGSAA